MKKHRHKLLTLAMLTALATALIHVFNRMIASAAVLKDMLTVSEKNYYHWRFGRIYYTKQGSGSPILLLHDLTPGSSGYEWNKIVKYLSTEHTVYTVDLLGCGRSDKPKITYTNFIYVQMVCDFIKNVIKEKTDVIASGFSTSFTFMACHNEKELFGKLMMVNPPSINTLAKCPTKRNKLLKMAIEIPVFGTLVYHIATSQENIRSLYMEKYFYNPFRVTNDMIDAYYEGSHRSSSEAKYLYSSLATHYVNLNINHGVKSINNSIMLLMGTGEVNKESITEGYLQLNPAIEIVETAGKHLPQMEHPEDFMEQVGIFF